MRGFLKRRRQCRIVEKHLLDNGGFRFRGQRVVVPEHVSLGIKEAIANGSYEFAECELINRHLPNDQPVIELGGCLGLVSSFLANKLLANTQLIVVEANPTLIEVCRQNATLGGVRGATDVLQNAIAYDELEVAFIVSDNVHIGKLGETGGTDTILVESIRFEQIVDHITPADTYSLICDIEGAELDLFERDTQVLQRCGMMVIELHPEAYEARGRTVGNVIDMVRGTGLRLVEQYQNVYAFVR